MIGLPIKVGVTMNIVECYKKIGEVQDTLTKWFDAISEQFSTYENIIDCMVLRKYESEEMFNHLSKIKLFKVDSLTTAELFCRLTEEQYEMCGLTKNGQFMLSGRYCVPIRTIDGKVSAIVGYYPDSRKYVTTPTFGFSKSTSLFGVEHTEYFTADYVCLCEGIFDTLSLQAYGFPALGNQGLDLSVFKSEMLKRYRKIVAIPDGDKAGQSANPYKVNIAGRKSRGWQIPIDNMFVDLSRYSTDVKDVDDLLKSDGVDLEKLDSIFRNGKYISVLTK